MRSLSVVTRSGISSLTISEVLARLQPGQDTSEPGDEVGCKLRPRNNQCSGNDERGGH